MHDESQSQFDESQSQFVSSVVLKKETDGRNL